MQHVHAVEIDRELEATLRATLDSRMNVSLVFGDATSLDSRR